MNLFLFPIGWLESVAYPMSGTQVLHQLGNRIPVPVPVPDSSFQDRRLGISGYPVYIPKSHGELNLT